MKYCSSCGENVESRVPDGDNRPRYICVACDTIHYQNPRIVAGCLPEWDGKLLLCRRAIEPRHGFWTPPAGFMENGETVEDAASRETLEEANARVDNLRLFAVYSIPHINQVHMFFLSRLIDTDFSPGIESLDVELFDEAAVPWDSLAFRVTTLALQDYYRDREATHLNQIII